ncbi:hypothetical protein HZ992_12460 [Rhizobacter sp. AJA081-3]|uniref:hypothetical protein n=1 Tax=Rhizobacter sp. AJA081-3 TaxID=2753607 RepID=UPI001ADEFA22|nr:hypothetical protein [Rhizobacter sp. AJA081-3]QTN25708.1 hypothetical protein HZ992_12460 [Rhizobacter sp. AJA081-3]
MPLISRRSMLVQATFDMSRTFVRRTLEARLLLSQGTAAPRVFATSRAPTTDGLERLDGAISFIVPAEAVTADTSFALELREPAAAAGAGALVLRYPEGSAMRALQAWPDPMTVRIVMVPVRTVDCKDKSVHEAPVFDTDLRDRITNNVYNLLPVNDLQIVFSDHVIAPAGCDDGDVMAKLAELARSEQRGPEWFYQGHLSQNIGGYGLVPASADAGARLNWLGYWPGGVPVNVVHELGHNLGRDHTFDDQGYTPIAASDYGGRPQYGFALRGGPHPWWSGNDIGHKIIPPTTTASPSDAFDPKNKNQSRVDNGPDNNFFDVMSYTQLYWVSAYTYKAWAERIRDINALVASAGRASAQSAARVAQTAGASNRLLAIYFNRTGTALWVAEDGALPAAGRRDATLVVDGIERPVQVHVTLDGSGKPGLIRVDPGERLDWVGKTVELRLDGRSLWHRP